MKREDADAGLYGRCNDGHVIVVATYGKVLESLLGIDNNIAVIITVIMPHRQWSFL